MNDIFEEIFKRETELDLKKSGIFLWKIIQEI